MSHRKLFAGGLHYGTGEGIPTCGCCYGSRIGWGYDPASIRLSVLLHLHGLTCVVRSCTLRAAAPAELRAYFSQFGKISSAQVMYNRETCKSRGFGFVIFEEDAALDRALSSRIHTIDDKAVRVLVLPCPPSHVSASKPLPRTC